MLSQAAQFLLESIFNLFLVAVLLRFYMQLMRVSFRNPFAQFIVAVTDFAIRPMRRYVPGFAGVDLSTLLLAWVIEFVLLLALYGLRGYPFLAAGAAALPAFAALALVLLLKLTLYILLGLVFVQAILSWVNPFSPIAPMLAALTRPVMRPVQRVLPPIGNVDLSPLVVFLAVQLVLMVPVAKLEELARGLL
jgi:YggT family protein